MTEDSEEVDEVGVEYIEWCSFVESAYVDAEVDVELALVSQAFGERREERKVVLMVVGSVNAREVEGDKECVEFKEDGEDGGEDEEERLLLAGAATTFPTEASEKAPEEDEAANVSLLVALSESVLLCSLYVGVSEISLYGDLISERLGFGCTRSKPNVLASPANIFLGVKKRLSNE